MANPNSQSPSLIDSFLRFFTSDTRPEPATTDPNFDREWKRSANESVPGVVRPVRTMSSKAPIPSTNAAQSSLRYEIRELPFASSSRAL